MRIRVTDDQFEINDDGILHKPTGYKFTPRLGNPTEGHVNEGKLGDVLPNGDDFRPLEVRERAKSLWGNHIQTSRGFAEWREKLKRK